MRRIDLVWGAGLLLKGIGATWDVAWHFKILREALTPPHLVNVAGSILCAYALWYEWRHRDARTTGPLLVVCAGVATFLLAIPVDQIWHELFGLDLTTWSPPHLMLFYGTAVTEFGVLLLYRTRRGTTVWDHAFLAYLFIFFAASLYFPLTYNEYATVAVQTALVSPELMGADLVEKAASVNYDPFTGTPTWLYPVYSVGIALFVGTMARVWMGRGWAFIALAGLSAERALADGILGLFDWPHSALPLQFAFMGAAIELAWLVRVPTLVSLSAGAIAGTAVGYAWFVRPLTIGPAVPLTGASWPLGLAAAFAGALLALLFVRRGLRHVGSVPHLRSIKDVREWLTASR